MNKWNAWLLLIVLLTTGLGIGCGSSNGGSSSECDRSEIENAELNVGDQAPDFRLPDHKGGFVRLSDFEGKNHVVIAFFPAAFTPV